LTDYKTLTRVGKSRSWRGDDMDKKAIYICSAPDFDGLSAVDKKLLIFPLVDAINDFYKDPDNRRKYDEWLQNQKSVA